ncbi:putative zinc finger protein [Thermosporothrix hazakensis]|jgi:hypothetical protein|uniref:Putative zinc finger protein n=1 Tax=Thermosporothrix hazakensis TaxID=644383 RepID=A0A326UD63_THEHA|nr:zf-HC2 domain-containing protein [Thermosporothrix hazakensis]PZW23883.1 putative zinc finger protein [Thermosporothrix hazakensis]GCE48513.1 hypothetical protein KTH_33820 [Thermosporothrix hazakensis]
MHCSRASRYIQLYIDQHLPLNKMRELEKHLSSCSRCQQELRQLECISRAIQSFDLVQEPADLTHNIMQRIALRTRQAEEARRRQTLQQEAEKLFRPSFPELLVAIILASVATIGVMASEPSLRSMLPIGNGHDILSQLLMTIWSMLMGMNSNILMLSFWVFGTLIGIWITLLLAGSEVRTIWFKAVLDRLPVW